MQTTSIPEKAGEAADWFETATRPNGESFDRLKEDAPGWVRDLVRDAHGTDVLPDDYRFSMIRDSLQWIYDNDIEDVADGEHEFADDAPSVYTGDRFAWLASHLSRQGYCDTALAEFGPFDSIDKIVGAGWYLEAREIFVDVFNALEQI